MSRIPTIGFAAFDNTSPLREHSFTLRALQPDDVHIDVKYCGICQSDLRKIEGGRGPVRFPIVPGHEIAGVVKAVGSSVSNYKVGDRVGVGCICGSCQNCAHCEKSEEMFCSKLMLTANGINQYGEVNPGGYARDMVIPERYVLRFPDNVPLDAGAPLLCAGITTYSALCHYGMNKPGLRIGVVGLGGLGHVAIMFIKAFGAIPVVLSRTEAKRQESEKLGAKEFIATTDKKQMDEAKASLHGILDTAGIAEGIEQYFNLMKVDGTIVALGVPLAAVPVKGFQLIVRRRQYGGSIIGGIKETQEMLDFCGRNKVLPWIEKIDVHDVNEAYQRMLKSDVRYRFVIDISTLPPMGVSASN